MTNGEKVNTGSGIIEEPKKKKIDVIKDLAYDLKDQQSNLYDRLASLKYRTLGASGNVTDEIKGSDPGDDTLSMLEDILRSAINYGSSCHRVVTELDSDL